jgi:glycosyltransferase 2 family protein
MKRNTVSFFIGLTLGILLLAFWILNIDVNFLVSSFRKINVQYVVLAGLFYTIAYIIRSYRWNLLIKKQVSLTLKDTWLISSAGNWVNYLIPIRAGELIKALLIKRLKHKSAVSVLPSVFIDKFFDTLGIFFVLIMIPIMRINISKGLQILIFLLIIIFVIAFTILTLAAKKKRIITLILKVLFAWLPEGSRNKINNLIELFIDGLNIFDHHHMIIIYAILLTIIGMLFDGLYFFMLFKAFNQNLGFIIVLFGYTLINLSYALPQPPAQLGSNEWMMIIIFAIGFGFDKNVASSIMVFAHIFTTCIITVLGLIGFSYAGIKSVKQIKGEL